MLYDDEPSLELFSPMLGENFIEYPMLEEYGVPSVEEFPDNGPYEDYQEDNQENEFTGAENKEKKDFVNNAGEKRERHEFLLYFSYPREGSYVKLINQRFVTGVNRSR